MLGSQALFFTVYHTAVIRLFLIGMNEVDDITLEWGIVLVLLMNRSVYFVFFFFVTLDPQLIGPWLMLPSVLPSSN